MIMNDYTEVRADDALTPRSTALNVYDLLTDVARVIQEEPKRMDMTDWLQTFHRTLEPERLPVCGTVGCIAGWMDVLARDTMTPISMVDGSGHNVYNRLIGAHSYDVNLRRDFDSAFANTTVRDEEYNELTIGTPEYAAAVARRVIRLRDTYADILRDIPTPFALAQNPEKE